MPILKYHGPTCPGFGQPHEPEERHVFMSREQASAHFRKVAQAHPEITGAYLDWGTDRAMLVDRDGKRRRP